MKAAASWLGYIMLHGFADSYRMTTGLNGDVDANAKVIIIDQVRWASLYFTGYSHFWIM